MRCLTLGDALAANGHQCAFFCRDHAEAPLALVEDRGHILHRLARPTEAGGCGDLAHSRWLPVGQECDATETIDALGSDFDWFVVDHYALDARWHRAVRPTVRRLLVMDDLADRELHCDVLVDQNLQEMPGRYSHLAPLGCRMLLGPRYALLSPAFADLREAALRRPIGRVSRISVFFGGLDTSPATLLALKALTRAGLDCEAVEIIAPPHHPHIEEIAQWRNARQKASLIARTSDMAGMLAAADLAIGAGGVTMWERCCLGTPSVIVTIAQNQQQGARAAALRGAVVLAGDIAELDEAGLATVLQGLAADPAARERLRAKASALVDGQGRGRVVRAMSAPEISLLPAREEHCEAIWPWRNHPETRRYFFNPGPIDLASHKAWFQRALAEPDRVLLIAYEHGDPVGVLRFDIRAEQASVSLYIAPGNGGRGLGTSILLAGSDWLREQRPEVDWVEAEILPENIASLRAFDAAGYVPFGGKFRRHLKMRVPS